MRRCQSRKDGEPMIGLAVQVSGERPVCAQHYFGVLLASIDVLVVPAGACR